MQKFEFLRQPLLGELAMSRKKKERKKEKKRPFIVATYVYASSQGQRTQSAWTNTSSAQNMANIQIFPLIPYSKTPPPTQQMIASFFAV